MAHTEEEPLLKPQAQQATAYVALEHPVAEWDQPLLACCGNGDMQGCATFSLVHVLPCVAFGLNIMYLAQCPYLETAIPVWDGHNLKRAFQKSFLLHAVIYFLLFIFSAHLFLGATNMQAAVCPHGPVDEMSLTHHLEERPHRKLLHGHHEHDGPPHEPHHPHPPPITPWEDLTPECQVAIVGKSVIAVWMMLCFFAGVAYCAYRRTQLREKFGIAVDLRLFFPKFEELTCVYVASTSNGELVAAGTRFGDFCTWLWCGPCALCQETRTLWTNNVEDGVWRGPAQLPTTCPPQPQFVTGMPAPKQVEY